MARSLEMLLLSSCVGERCGRVRFEQVMHLLSSSSSSFSSPDENYSLLIICIYIIYIYKLRGAQHRFNIFPKQMRYVGAVSMLHVMLDVPMLCRAKKPEFGNHRQSFVLKQNN